MRRNWVMLLGTAGAMGLLIASQAAAGTVYSWVTEDGTYAFTDDTKRIPARYKAEAKRRDVGKLSEYEQLTLSDAGSDDAYAERLAARLEGLRSYGGKTMVGGAGVAGRDSTYLGVRTSSQTALQFPVDRGDGSGPIVVEKVRSKQRDGNSTRHLTVVKQGDRVISVVAPERTSGSPIQAHDSDFD